jgi:hypothetical protein
MKVLDREILYGDRSPTPMALTQSEADAMIAEGFLLDVYDKREGKFTLQPPYELGHDDARGLWLIRQLIPDV